MRVLHVVSYFPPDRIGGVGEVAAHLHEGLLAAGHDSMVLTAGHTTSDPRVLRIATSPLRFLVNLARHAPTARGFDIVHCHQGDALLLLLALRLQRVPVRVLTTMHVSYRGMARAFQPYPIERQWFARDFESWRYRQLSAPVNQWMSSLVMRIADEVIFISRSAARDCLADERAARAHVVYNGLPPLAGAAAPGPDPEPAELLYVGVPSHRKRIHALPAVLEHVRRRVPGARLRVIGFDLASQTPLRQDFERRGLLASVVCEGPLRSDELPPFYRAAKVLVVPSAYEGLPMVILEAARAGLPCVATQVSGHPEVIEEGRTGFLVDLDRPEQMADRCSRLLEDPGLQRRMGDAVREVVRVRFTLERQLREYLDHYERLCGTASAATGATR